MNTTYMIRGYFSIVFEVSRLYVDISRKYIMPGVDLIDELALTQVSDNPESREMVSRNNRLAEYREGAVAEIRKLAEDVSTPSSTFYLLYMFSTIIRS